MATGTGCVLRVASAVGASHANDAIMRIAHGLVADDTDRRYGDWRHVATGCNALVHVIFNAVVVAKLTCTPRHRGGALGRPSIVNNSKPSFVAASVLDLALRNETRE